MSEYVCVICGREGHTANDYDRPDWCRQIEGLKDELAGRYSVEFFGGTAHPRTDAGTIRGYGSDFDPTTEGTRIVGEFVFHDGHWWYAGRRAAAHPSGAGGGLRERIEAMRTERHPEDNGLSYNDGWLDALNSVDILLGNDAKAHRHRWTDALADPVSGLRGCRCGAAE